MSDKSKLARSAFISHNNILKPLKRVLAISLSEFESIKDTNEH